MGLCTYVIPAIGHNKEKPCKSLASLGDFCALHQPKPVIVAVTAVTLAWRPFTTGDKVDATFQTKCDGAKDRLDAICSGGIQGGGMMFKGVGDKGPHRLLHQTKSGSNIVVFYRWVGAIMEVFGVGNHSGSDNKHYSLTWFNGSNAAVDLNKSSIT